MITITLSWEVIKIMIILGVLSIAGASTLIIYGIKKGRTQIMETLRQSVLEDPEFKEKLDYFLEEEKEKEVTKEIDTHKVVSFKEYVKKRVPEYTIEPTKEDLKAYLEIYGKYFRDELEGVIDNDQSFSEVERVIGKKFVLGLLFPCKKDSDK